MIDDEETRTESRGEHEERGLMTLGAHLNELRKRLIRAFVAFLIFFIAALFFQEELLAIMAKPHFWAQEHLAAQMHKRNLEKPPDLTEARWRRLLSRYEIEIDKASGMPKIPGIAAQSGNASETGRDESLRLLVALLYAERVKSKEPPKQLVVLKYQESFMVYMKVCGVFALLAGIPFMLYQFWKFISVGLYKHERKVVYIAAPLSFALFAAGILFGYYVLIRFGLQFLASYGNPELVHSMMSLDFYFGLVIMLTLIMGVVFQLPLVMLALAKIEIWPVSAMKRQRKFAILLIFIVAAVITPTPDPITQTLLAVPLIFLYEFGIILSRAWTPREEEDETKAGAAEETA